MAPVMRELWGVELAPVHIVVCESSTEAQFSRHIVIDGYYVSGVSDARAYAEKVREGCQRMYAVTE